MINYDNYRGAGTIFSLVRQAPALPSSLSPFPLLPIPVPYIVNP